MPPSESDSDSEEEEEEEEEEADVGETARQLGGVSIGGDE